jgi:cell fate regulator YaaT (PSP1 superfamily)
MPGCEGCAFKGLSTAVEDSFVGVRFAEETNLTLCSSGAAIYAQGDKVIVDTESGPTFGTVARSPMPVFKPCQKSSAQPILRLVTDQDRQAYEQKIGRELATKTFCRERSRELKLDMKVSKVEYTLDCRRAKIYFTSEDRVDFRRLVKEVSRRFKVRVRMVQVGARDEAGLVGGIGVCGRTLCCSTWLKDFRPISIQMAKRQNLSLNPSKISGQCGRLLCCLAYEDDQYEKPKKKRERGEASAS